MSLDTSPPGVLDAAPRGSDLELEALRAEVQQLRKRCETSEFQMQVAVKEAKVDREEVENARASTATLRNEIAKLRAQCEFYSDEASQVPALQQKVKEAELNRSDAELKLKRAEDLALQHSAAVPEEVYELERTKVQVASLQAELARLKAESESNVAMAASLQERCKDAESRAEAYRLEVEQNAAELGSREQMLAEEIRSQFEARERVLIEEMNARFESRISELSSTHQESTRELQRLQEQVSNAQRQAANAAQTAAEWEVNATMAKASSADLERQIEEERSAAG